MKAGDAVTLLHCPAHPEAIGSVGTVVAHHTDLGGFGADVVEVEYEAKGQSHVMPFAPGNLAGGA